MRGGRTPRLLSLNHRAFGLVTDLVKPRNGKLKIGEERVALNRRMVRHQFRRRRAAALVEVFPGELIFRSGTLRYRTIGRAQGPIGQDLADRIFPGLRIWRMFGHEVPLRLHRI